MRSPTPHLAPVVWLLIVPPVVLVPLWLAAAYLRSEAAPPCQKDVPGCPGPATAALPASPLPSQPVAPQPVATQALAARALPAPQIPEGLLGEWTLDTGGSDADEPEDRRTSLSVGINRIAYRNPGPEARLDLYETVAIHLIQAKDGTLTLGGDVTEGLAFPPGSPNAVPSRGEPRLVRLKLAPGGTLNANGLYGQDLPLEYVRPVPGK